MDEVGRPIAQAGASGRLVEDFLSVVEATAPDGRPRYPREPVLAWLARFVVGREGGPNRDAPIYELCRLVDAIDALGRGRDRRDRFFFGLGRPTAAGFRAHVEGMLAGGGWRRPGFEATPRGLAALGGETPFTIRYGRMPFLTALYEFLAGMEGSDGADSLYYPELDTVLAEMLEDAAQPAAVAVNRIARHLYHYRRRHLERPAHDAKFNRILEFLRARSPEQRLRVDDAGIRDFWCAYGNDTAAGDFRAFRTVFDAFVAFMTALEDLALRDAVDAAAPIGPDRGHGEVEPADQAAALDSFGEWRSPLALLDRGPAARIKFFKATERDALELLMSYGPWAARLPLSLLRAEVFGRIQSGITTDLRFKKGPKTLRRRVACADAETYRHKRAAFDGQLAHVRQAEKAALYALLRAEAQETSTGETNVVALRPKHGVAAAPDALVGDDPPADRVQAAAEAARRAFQGLSRQGFDEALLDEAEHVEGFRVGAGALLAIGMQLEAFLGRIGAIDQATPDLEDWFELDRGVFRAQFAKIYGEVS